MNIENLDAFEAGTVFEADLVIVGGGPAGLTIAREFFNSPTRVLVLESGLLDETPDHAVLAELESVGEPHTEAQTHKRMAFHGPSASSWSHEQQPYGVRCRALGGSSHAWAGKLAAFDPIDFATRSWVPNTGWPIEYETLQPFVDRAAKVLNLSRKQPEPRFKTDSLHSFYWQFSRSRLDHLDIMRFGSEFVTFDADNVRVLLNATATRIGLTSDGGSFKDLEISTLEGVRSTVKAPVAVIAASGVENPRLLLASKSVQACGIGNAYDRVGRFLMDHPGARIGRFSPDSMAPIIKQFGFYAMRSGGRTDMFMHGLALTSSIQKQEELSNSAVYFMMERAPDDPWDALKRLLRRRSAKPLQDLRSLASGAGLITKGAGMKILASELTPEPLKKFIVNTAIRYDPNFVAEEFQNGGVPHKLTGISIDAITEQRPNPDSRVTLSERTDRFGVPLAKVDWRIGEDDRRGLVRIAQLVRDALTRAGLPQPDLEDWVAENRLSESVIIDMAHTLGTTRMSNDPKAGVVDRNCQVHGVHGLYIAGGSVFPTSGHANPTLMILSLAIRLADTIKSQFPRPKV
jgi:choline dehydrogenase-like flavoprotein